MRPAITEVRISSVEENGKVQQYAKVVGPIDLEDIESDVAEKEIYLWVRVAPEAPHAKQPTDVDQSGEDDAQQEAAEAVGASEMNRAQIATARTTVSAASPAMWSAKVPVTEGEFSVGSDVFVYVEVWALVRTKNLQREFQVYWYDNHVPVVPDSDADAPATAEAALSEAK
jgi:hypothetical protein